MAGKIRFWDDGSLPKPLIHTDGKISFNARCCCGCWEASDDFDRSDSTDLGTDWDECGGDWEILDGQLVANEQGVAVWKKSPTEDPPRYGIMTVKLIDPADGAHYRIYAFLEDCEGSGAVYADVVISSSSGVLLATVDVGGSGITSTGAVATSIASGHTLTFCVGGTELMAYVTTSTYPARACHDGTANASGIYFALSNESETEPAVFDDAYQTDHYDHDEECPSCGCDCDGKCLPLTLCLTITDEQGCSVLDGQEFTLESSGACGWLSDAWNCSPYSGLWWSFQPIGLWLGVTGVCSAFSLTLFNSSNVAILSLLAADSCTCDPLMFEWNGCEIDSDDCANHCCEGYEDCGKCADCDPNPAVTYCFCPGRFTVTITECPT